MKLASGVITAGGTLGILIPPSVMIIVYAAVAGQSVVKLYAAAMFPGFFLSFLYLVYIIGWAMINPKIAPPLPEEQTKVPVPDWMRKFQAAYSKNVFVGLVAGAGLAVAGDGDRDRARAASPIGCCSRTSPPRWCRSSWSPARSGWSGGTSSFTSRWPLEAAVEGVQQLGTPGLGTGPATRRRAGAAARLLSVVRRSSRWSARCWQVRYYSRLDADRLEVIKLLTSSIMPLGILTVVVLAVILFGITTATESAGVGAAGAFLLAFQARTLDWKRTKEAVFLTAKTTAMVCWLFVGSALFSGVFAILGGQALVEQWVLSLNMTPIQFMILSQAIIFVLGWPLEWTEIIVIFVPIFLPLLKHFNIDPVLWGMLVFVNLQAAFLSPPVAMSAFYLKGVAPKHVTLNQIFAGMMPYMLVVIVCMIIMYIWPGMTLWLPNYLYGG